MVPFRWDVVGLKSLRCRKLKRGNTQQCQAFLRIGSYRRFARVVPPPLLLLLYRCCTARVLLKFRRSVGWNRLACVQDGTRTYAHTHTHTQKKRSQLSQQENFEVRLLLYHGCYNIGKLRYYTGTPQQTTQQRKEKS